MYGTWLSRHVSRRTENVTARSVRRPIPIRNLRQTKGHKVRSLFPKSRLRLRILAQGDIDRQDVTKEYTKNVLRQTKNQSQPNEKSFAWDWKIVWRRKKQGQNEAGLAECGMSFYFVTWGCISMSTSNVRWPYIDGKSPDSRKIKTAPENHFRGCLWLGYLGSNQD